MGLIHWITSSALAMMQMLHPGGSAMAPQQPRAWRIPRAQIR
jgi:hypothetical protein